MSKQAKQHTLSDVVRNRIIERRMIRARELLDHPGQWREHPQSQADAMVGVLREVGIASTLKAWHSERAGGALVTWDGHLRKSLDPDLEWPVDILDITDQEADYLLSVFDPLAAMAQADAAALDALLASVNSGEAAVQAMLADLAAKAGLYPVDPNEEWQGMPEFEQEDVFGAIASIKVHFATHADLAAFAELVGQEVNAKTAFIWYPKREHENLKAYAVKDES